MNDPNLHRGLSSRDLDHIEGRHYDDVEGITDADRDELRGQDWMRALPVAEHAAIPLAMNPAGTQFRASCRCGWQGWHYRNLEAAHARMCAQEDATEHNVQYAEKAGA